MSLSVYLYFKGQCREAFEHYKAVFGAEEICRQSYSDGPPEMFGDEPPDLIMHTSIRIGDSILMGSDYAASCDTQINSGDNFAITFSPDSKEQADRLFPRLAAGGEITMPLQKTFWGSYYGLCTDQFGIHWMFNLALASTPVSTDAGS
ncbi:MAG: VOC family protein [Pirellulaceae bacterium]